MVCIRGDLAPAWLGKVLGLGVGYCMGFED
jgi:hypothetical protein